ncbi:MAG: hypothetical protein Q4G04_06155 [bacterium]|nr:hypothetical protein [bacterium]
MESININMIESKINDIIRKLDSGYDLKYLEENLPFILEVGNIFDKTSKINNTQHAEVYYAFLTRYLLSYMAKKYDKKFRYSLQSKNVDTACYSSGDNVIHFAEDLLFRKQPTFADLCFIVFHEFKHKMQRDDMTSSINNLIQIDPASILFLKDQVMLLNSQLYKNNHDLYYMENDANLFAVREMEKILPLNVIKETETGSKDNHSLYLLSDNADLSTKEYDDKQDLPILYKMDYEYKRFVKGKRIPEESLLSLIYNQGGIPKTYEELIEDKQKLIEKYKGQVTKRKTSTTDYILQETSVEKQIDEIYRLIVVSDPILTIQENFYWYNTSNDKTVAMPRISRIKQMLENCPQLIDIYDNDITTLLLEQLNKGSIDTISHLVNSLSNEKLKTKINNALQMQKINTRTSSSTTSAPITDEGMFMEEEFGREIPNERVYRPKINNEIKRAIERKHEKEELTKTREYIVNLKEEQRRKEIQQQFEEEQNEEDLGMSR